MEDTVNGRILGIPKSIPQNFHASLYSQRPLNGMIFHMAKWILLYHQNETTL